MTTDTLESAPLDELEQRFRANQLHMDIRLQEAQIKQLDRALALDASRRSFGSAGDQEVMEGLYAPEDYVDVMDYRRDNYGYQAYAATFTTKTDRQDGRNWPYWVSEPELAAIRGTVRLLAAYNKTCFGILNKLRNYTVSKGFTRKVVSKRGAPKSLTSAIETILDEFDVLNQITGSMDQEAIIRDIRDGEVALGLWHRGEGRVDLRPVEPDQISEPTNKGDLEEWLRTERQMGIEGEEGGLPFESNWSFGIHTTKGDVCNKHGYYVQWDGDPSNWDYLPGGNNPCYPPAGGANTWLEFRKSNTDRVIKRGVSDFWPVTGDVELARKMIRNLTHAGALQAAIAWIREMAPGTTQSQASSATMTTADWQTRTATQNGGTRTSYQQTYQPGSTLYLGANQKFVPPPWVQQSMAAGLVNIFEAMLRSISQIWSMPEHMITGSAQNNNYASILEAGSPFVKEVETRQGWHINLWTAVYWKVVWFNWRCGRLGKYAWRDIRQAVEIILTGPQVDVRDRMKETQRNILLLDAGIMSPVEAASREGMDYDDQVRQGAKKSQPPQQPGMPGMGGPTQVPPREESVQEAWTDEAREASAEARRATARQHLKALGFKRERSSGGSEYHRHPTTDTLVRISDHEVPETDERAYNASHGGFSWSSQGHNIVLSGNEAEDKERVANTLRGVHGELRSKGVDLSHTGRKQMSLRWTKSSADKTEGRLKSLGYETARPSKDLVQVVKDGYVVARVDKSGVSGPKAKEVGKQLGLYVVESELSEHENDIVSTGGFAKLAGATGSHWGTYP